MVRPQRVSLAASNLPTYASICPGDDEHERRRDKSSMVHNAKEDRSWCRLNRASGVGSRGISIRIHFLLAGSGGVRSARSSIRLSGDRSRTSMKHGGGDISSFIKCSDYGRKL